MYLHLRVLAPPITCNTMNTSICASLPWVAPRDSCKACLKCVWRVLAGLHCLSGGGHEDMGC